MKNERRGLEIVMPISSKKEETAMPQMRTGIPRWFDHICKKGNPNFWARKKFPIVALVMVFQKGRASKSQRILVELNLVINGRSVPHKGYCNFRIEPDHVLVCDLRLLFSDSEWLGLDALLIEREWNIVQVSYEAPSSVTLSEWGVFVYKQGTTNTEEYIQFMCPDPKYSQRANISPTMTKDPKQEPRKQIETLGMDKILGTILSNARDMEGLFKNKGLAHPTMTMLNDLYKEVHDVSEGKPLDDKKSRLAPFLQMYNAFSDFAAKFDDHTDEMKPPKNVGEASTSGHQGSSEEEDRDAEEEEIMREIFLKGIGAGLREVQISFPSLDVDTTMDATFNRGEWVRLSLPPKTKKERKMFIEGIFNGLIEAKLSFPTLKQWEILKTVTLQRRDFTEMIVPSSNDPLLQAFMMMKRGSCESERAKSKLICKLVEEHIALRKKFEKIENEIATLDNSKKGHSLDEKLAAVLKGRAEELQRHYDADIEGFKNSKEIQDFMKATYSYGMGDGLLEAQAVFLALDIVILILVFEGNENEISAQEKLNTQYGDFGEKLNTQFDQHNSKKDHSLDGTNDNSHTKESSFSDSKSSLNSTKFRADIGKVSCKDVTKHEMLFAALKERGEELIRLYDAEIKELQNSKEDRDQMSAKYLSGLRDGVLEAQSTLVSLNTDGTTPMFEENKKHITHEAANDDTVGQNHDDKTIIIDDSPSPAGPEFDKARDTPYPYGCFWRILHACFCKCFS